MRRHHKLFFSCLGMIGIVPFGFCQVTFSSSQTPEIVIDPSSNQTERLAANELARWLGEITSRKLRVVESVVAKENSILVGRGAAVARYFPEVDFSRLGTEEVVLKSKGNRLLVTGGRPRGAVYAVNRLLHRQGVRWWTPWATHVPKRAGMTIDRLDVRESPAFEARSPFWYHAFDRDWARRNNSNAMHARLTPEDGGKIEYEEFVHTFYSLVPPAKHFKDHPEWFSLIGGQRKVEGGQLCTTNPQLRDFVVEQVRQRLRAKPQSRIVSVSQNDWYGACECPDCKKIDEAEGSASGTMIALANYVGEEIEEEFPDVAVDTLAYQYTRKAPKTVRPRKNVIVRLCSIECNFAEPLTHPSNASFAQDIRDWNRLTNRLHVWNYVTDFPHYLLPYPNWYVVGPNQRFFAQNGVSGLFEQGAYQSHGASMAEMHAWVQSQLLWDPNQYDRALMREFLNGYYGSAAKPIERYMNLMAKAAQPHPMNIWIGPDAPFFKARTVLQAEVQWQEAERLVSQNPDLLWRVRVGHLPIRYVLLNRWAGLRAEALREKIRWPLSESRKAVADEWIALATGKGPEGWAPITHLSESGLRPESWVQRFAIDPQSFSLPNRSAKTALPPDLVLPAGAEVVEGQDDQARLYGEGDLSELRPDPSASDGIACRMPGGHAEWAFQLPISKLPAKVVSGRWKAYVVVRLEGEGARPEAVAFSAGIYSSDQRKALASIQPSIAQAGNGYRTYAIGSVSLDASSYLWVAPSGNGSAKAVWVDRLLLVKE